MSFFHPYFHPDLDYNTCSLVAEDSDIQKILDFVASDPFVSLFDHNFVVDCILDIDFVVDCNQAVEIVLDYVDNDQIFYDENVYVDYNDLRLDDL